jgi:murein DD-endopeptidase MepM/ murein hydrolase activator NlpD
MVAPTPLVARLACAAIAVFGAWRPLHAQQSARTDTAAGHGYLGQPFRKDALTPWRRGSVSSSQLHWTLPDEDAGDATAPQARSFRLRQHTLPGPLYAHSVKERESGLMTALADLLVPILGIARTDIRNDFGARRIGHRHQGVDIPAPKGTPVVATVDGSVLKMKWDAGGGRTIRLLDRTGKFVFYYAHLSGYATGLREGQPVRQGQVLGFVGRTGSVEGNGAHLHLGISSLLADPEHWWQARPLNPYRFLEHAFGFGCDSAASGSWTCGGDAAVEAGSGSTD